MSRYFTNVKNTIEERVNIAYIDELYTKDAEGEFRKIVAGESEGADIELPTYLKDSSIEILGSTVFSAINPGGISIGIGLNPTSLSNRTSMTTNAFRVTGTPSSNYTNYGNGIITNKLGNELNLADIISSQKNYLKPETIEFRNTESSTRSVLNDAFFSLYGSSFENIYRLLLRRDLMMIIDNNIEKYGNYKFDRIDSRLLNQPMKTLMLSDISDSQANYLKPDKIEFSNETGLSSAGLSYKIGDVVHTKTIHEIAEAAQPYITEMGIDFDFDFNDFSRTVLTNHSLSTRLLNAVSDAEQSYMTTLNGEQMVVKTPEGTVNTETKDIVDVTNNLKGLTVSAADINNAVANSGAVPDYIQPESIRFQNLFEDQTYPIELRKNSNNVYARIRNNDIGLVNTKFGYNCSLNGASLILRDPDGINVTTEYGNDDIRVHYGEDPRITIYAATRDVINVTNNLKTLNSTAAQIDAAVIASGGTTYPYLKPTALELTINDSTRNFTGKSTGGQTLFLLNSNILRHSRQLSIGLDSEAGQRVHVNDNGIKIYNQAVAKETTINTDKIQFRRNLVFEDIQFAHLKDLLVPKIRVVNSNSTETLYKSHAELIAPTSSAVKIPSEVGRYILELGTGWGQLGVAGNTTTFFLWAPIGRLVTVEASHLMGGAGFPLLSPFVQGGLNFSGYQASSFGLSLPVGIDHNLQGMKLIFTVGEEYTSMLSW